MENEEFNLDEELKDVREKREKEEEQRREELYDYLNKLKVKRIAQNGVAIGLAIVLIGGGILAIRHKGKQDTPVDPYSITEVDNTVTLTRYYTVEFGDTLSGISAETGIPMSRIQNDNDISNPNMIDMNQRLVLNYQVEEEDIDKYTQVIFVNGQNISDIANIYNTNISTLTTLNPNSIITTNGAITITSDTLVVPNFSATNEYSEGNQNQR